MYDNLCKKSPGTSAGQPADSAKLFKTAEADLKNSSGELSSTVVRHGEAGS